MKRDPNKPQVDTKKRATGELPDRSGRLTGHTTEPLKGTDPPTTARRPMPAPEKKKAP
ncbi:MAG TPA: hypothetical protein VFY72_05375 [Beijerinckiaceae bacterium]|jgi:hypothetical protein|nr:hypothetical protein [Beijerinckiaceae bacterium]